MGATSVCGGVKASSGIMMLLNLLFLAAVLRSSYCYVDNVDEEIVDDIFGPPTGISQDLCIPSGGDQVCSGQGQCVFGQCHCKEGWQGQFCSECVGCRSADQQGQGQCDRLRACVESVGFGQYWKHFGSAYAAKHECTQIQPYTFINPRADLGRVCSLQYEPTCGLDGRTYGNPCEAESHGIAIHCSGQCPCPSTEPVCEFHDNLDGDSICPAYRFVVKGEKVYVYRPPCLADDLEVNVGVWHGEVLTEGYERYPNGWGVLHYKEQDHLNRKEYTGHMKKGLRDGYGVLYWKDGSYYSGKWSEDMKEGEGTLFYANGDIYTGQWVKEKKTGDGKYMYSAGGAYSGGFEGGKKNGAGNNYVMRPDDQWQFFNGEYSQGARANGEFNSSAGFTYSGEFSPFNGNFNGSGVYIWACGKRYTGHFQAGEPSGHGTLTYPQGWSYTGAFCAGKFQGYGKFTWSENHFYEGEFLKGEMTGVGVYGFADGGLYDNSVGLYYPDRTDKSVFQEAHFDGKVLRVKKKSQEFNSNSGYGR